MWDTDENDEIELCEILLEDGTWRGLRAMTPAGRALKIHVLRFGVEIYLPLSSPVLSRVDLLLASEQVHPSL